MSWTCRRSRCLPERGLNSARARPLRCRMSAGPGSTWLTCSRRIPADPLKSERRLPDNKPRRSPQWTKGLPIVGSADFVADQDAN